MPVILECECGHRTYRPNHTNSIMRSKCARCGSAVLHRVKAQKATKVKSAAPAKPSSDKGVKQRPRVKACPAATGCPQVPDCGGCAYAPVTPFAGLGHTVKTLHPMMAMQEGETVAEARAKMPGELSTEMSQGAPTAATESAEPTPGNVQEDVPAPTPSVKVGQAQGRSPIAKVRAPRVPKTPPPAAHAVVSTAMLKAAWARVQARKGANAEALEAV